MSMRVERPASTRTQTRRNRGSGPAAGREQSAAVSEPEQVKYAGLYFPVSRIQDIQLAVIYRRTSVSDYIWDRIEERVAADLLSLNDRVAEGDVSMVEIIARLDRPTRSRANSGEKKKTLALYYPISRIQQIKVAAAFSAMSMAGYVWSIIEDEVHADLRELGTVLIQRGGTLSPIV